MNATLLVIGDSRLDRDHCGVVRRMLSDAPVPILEDIVTTSTPGSAAFSALLCASMDIDVQLVSAFAQDRDGFELRALMQLSGVELFGLPAEGHTPTHERLIAAGRELAVFERGSSRLAPYISDVATINALLSAAGLVLVSDSGGGLLSSPTLVHALQRTSTSILWSAHARGVRPRDGVSLVLVRDHDARQILGADEAGSVIELAQALRRHWHAHALAMTVDQCGAVLVGADSSLFVPAPSGRRMGSRYEFDAAVATAMAQGANAKDALCFAMEGQIPSSGQQGNLIDVRPEATSRARSFAL